MEFIPFLRVTISRFLWTRKYTAELAFFLFISGMSLAAIRMLEFFSAQQNPVCMQSAN